MLLPVLSLLKYCEIISTITASFLALSLANLYTVLLFFIHFQVTMCHTDFAAQLKGRKHTDTSQTLAAIKEMLSFILR